MNTKEDIEKTFLKDLAEYNKIFKKIEKSEELLNALTQESKMSQKDVNHLYIEFKINHAELLLAELEKFVDLMEKNYACLEDSWSLIDGSKIDLRHIKASKNLDFDKTIKKCDEIIKKVYLKYEELERDKKKLTRNGFLKFLMWYGSIYSLLSLGVGFFIWDSLKDQKVVAVLVWIIILAFTWDWAKGKFWRKE